MSSRVDMLAGQALAGLLAHPHHAAHPMTVDAQALAVRVVALARAVDVELSNGEADESWPRPISVPEALGSLDADMKAQRDARQKGRR